MCTVTASSATRSSMRPSSQCSSSRTASFLCLLLRCVHCQTFICSILTPFVQPTGKESLAERWILQKLNVAAQETNRQLTERNFMAATNAVYNFWLYELCDVYIEAMKPMTDASASPETRESAQQTLYTCLDQGLRLLHPFMPFVTEELWQRLPRRPNDSTPSIMLAQFPVFVSFVYLVSTDAAAEQINRTQNSSLTQLNLISCSLPSRLRGRSPRHITSRLMFKVILSSSIY